MIEYHSFTTTNQERLNIMTTSEIDLRDCHITGSKTAAPFYDQKVRVIGSNKTGTTEMFGVLTGVTFNKAHPNDPLPSQIIVYMEGQQNTVFDATRSGIWISLVDEPKPAGRFKVGVTGS